MDNRTILQAFEWYVSNDGSFWKRTEGAAPSFSSLGFTTVWLPPACKGSAGINDVGYGIYDLYDLGEFNQKGTVRTKYGTKKEYLNAIKALQKNNIYVLSDIVLNQKMGADETETVQAVEENRNNRNDQISGEETIETWTKFTFPGRKGKYDPFVWDHTCFDGTDWDEKGHRNSIFRFNGTDWDNEVDSEYGNYDYLMGCDLDFANPKVVDEIKRWGHWYFDTTGSDGVRLDAVKHIHFTFFEDWLKDMCAYTGRDIFAVGEYWNGDLGRLLHYLDVNNNCLSLFDVCLHFHFYDASNSSGNYDMGALCNDTLVRAREANAVTFVDNHDTQPGQALQSFVQPWFKPLAYALILMSAYGWPCVFYGDLFGIGHDQIAPTEDLPAMVAVRKKYAYGEEISYFDDHDVIGLSRCGDDEHEDSGLAMIMTDGPGGQKYMQVNQKYAGRVFADVLHHCPEEITLDENGGAVFRCDGGSVSIWILKEKVEDIEESVRQFKADSSAFFPW